MKKCKYCYTDRDLKIDKIGRIYSICNPCDINQKRIQGKKIYRELSRKQKEEANKKRSESLLKSWAKRTKEQEKERVKKIKLTKKERYGDPNYNNQEKVKNKSKKEKLKIRKKHHNSMKKNKSYGKSKREDLFYKYLQQFIDFNIKRHVFYRGFNIDFYSPAYDIYIQFDGDYWHGYLGVDERTEQGRYIKKVVERDKKQNKLIDNLIRIRESEFIHSHKNFN